MSAVLPVAIATNIWVTQSGCAGQPGILITGRPAWERNSVDKYPPGFSFKNCKPIDSDGFGLVAGIPPQQAQSPIATTKSAFSANSLIHSFLGRSNIVSYRPDPFGP